MVKYDEKRERIKYRAVKNYLNVYDNNSSFDGTWNSIETLLFLPALIVMAIIIFIIGLIIDKISEYLMSTIERYITELKIVKEIGEKLEVKEK